MSNNHENTVRITAIIPVSIQETLQKAAELSGATLNQFMIQAALKEAKKLINDIISISLTITWTRDPFDRIITANAMLNNNILLSKDQNILNNYLYAKWDD